MPLQDELCFVQFIHPGGEHQPDESGFKDWNRKAHKRKFVEISGRRHRGGDSFEGPLRFWAEWEPQSVVTEIDDPIDGGPRFVHQPFYVVPTNCDGLQNTDPFVFGGFLYTGCQQWTKRGATQLRYLERGSVILFGSRLGSQFCIDTVFVVRDRKEHHARNYKTGFRNLVSEAFQEATLSVWYSDKNNSCAPESCRLYFGATIDEPVNGMFSYFPCMPAKDCPRGFARPAIDLPDVINPALQQGKRLNKGVTLKVATDYWNAVRESVESSGLWLGVHADLPPRKP